MNSKKFILIVFLVVISGFSCELIKIREKSQYQIKPDPSKSIGTIALLTKELGEGNIIGAVNLINKNTTSFNPDSLIDIQEKLYNLSRKIYAKPITYYKIDTISQDRHNILVEYDYLFEIIFETQKVDSNWFINHFIY
ncbi:MAG: hypothetical protein ACUVQ1_07120 [Candidatus Kapaibacteriales bacterium]